MLREGSPAHSCSNVGESRPLSSASARRTIRSIISTLSSGCAPAAVSADSMTASVPSHTAFATSLASARVGRVRVTMLSSICVAVITGTILRRAAWMIRRCQTGTSSGPTSTPRSPRATMIPSEASTIAFELLQRQRVSRSWR